MRTTILTLFFCAFALRAQAGSATWKATPTSSNWNTATNWTPATVPNGAGDVASFALSNITAISSQEDIEIASVVFNADASPFTITTNAQPGENADLTIDGTGVTNNSAVPQNFIVGRAGTIFFRNTATAGNGTNFTANKGVVFYETSTAGGASFVINGAEAPEEGGGGVVFYDSSTAGDATFTLNGATVTFAYGGAVGFYGLSSAGNGVFVLNSTSRLGPDPSFIVFDGSATAANGVFTINSGISSPRITFNGNATAGNATFTAIGGQGPNKYGGQVYFYGYSFTGVPTAGNATFVSNGGDGAGATGGQVYFSSESTAAQSMLTANGGTDGGGGGNIEFDGNSQGGEAQLELLGNGYLDVSARSPSVPDATVGSIAGDGFVYLGSRNLTVGSNNLSTAFSGVIQEKGGLVNDTGGSLTKIGTGTLTLSGASIYTGGTSVMQGTLRARNTSGSATGTNTVSVNGGTLGGGGIIAGAVTIGSGSGPGAFLQPSVGGAKPTTLTIQSALTFSANGTYTCKLNTKNAKADKVLAQGVTIGGGAQFDLSVVKNQKLSAGASFTVISNTSAAPISGTFANVADGSTFTIGRNTFQASYRGGEGNDLTLTVMP